MEGGFGAWRHKTPISVSLPHIFVKSILMSLMGCNYKGRVTLGLAVTEGKHPGFLGVRVAADANLQLAWLGFSFARNLRNDALCVIANHVH